jgi:hypothetical protein
MDSKVSNPCENSIISSNTKTKIFPQNLIKSWVVTVRAMTFLPPSLSSSNYKHRSADSWREQQADLCNMNKHGKGRGMVEVVVIFPHRKIFPFALSIYLDTSRPLPRKLKV